MKPGEEIMADYLLKGGKMLSKTCPNCGSPLFEYINEELCVVCKERGLAGEKSKRTPVPPETRAPRNKKMEAGTEYPGDTLAGEIEETIRCLCIRVQEEQRPEDCRILMECIRVGIDSLRALYG